MLSQSIKLDCTHRGGFSGSLGVDLVACCSGSFLTLVFLVATAGDWSSDEVRFLPFLTGDAAGRLAGDRTSSSSSSEEEADGWGSVLVTLSVCFRFEGEATEATGVDGAVAVLVGFLVEGGAWSTESASELSDLCSFLMAATLVLILAGTFFLIVVDSAAGGSSGESR